MAINNDCPECGNTLSPRSQRCSCGWVKVERKEPARADHRCAFTTSGRRCPLPGTMSPFPAGNSWWYCRRHYQTLSDPRLGEVELRYIEENYQRILNEEYVDWRKKLFD
jgi:hypothetical protein